MRIILAISNFSDVVPKFIIPNVSTCIISEKDLKDLNKISAALLEAEENNEKARIRELELNRKISQLEAELGAAMDGLRAARLETEELKSSLMGKKR